MNAPRIANAVPSVDWPSEDHILPRRIFEREDVYAAEIENIFRGPVWIPVAHDAEIPQAHDFKTSQIGDIPILIIRAADGEVRAFRNACTHRGTQLITQNRGNAPVLECPYHRWAFDGKGALQTCPGEPDFLAILCYFHELTIKRFSDIIRLFHHLFNIIYLTFSGICHF